MSRISYLIAFLGLSSLAASHTIITYPGWRGDNLITNNTWPYGMQWDYPCGGMGTSSNRTLWPVNGGAIAIQPGWFQGHATAFFYVNIGFGMAGPDNGPSPIADVWPGPVHTYPIIPIFQITGPSKGPYPGTFCLPQVPLPANVTVNIGDNATLQIVEVAGHGASLYNCVDITFADPKDVPEVNGSNCFNSSDIGFNNVYTMTLQAAVNSTSGAIRSLVSPQRESWAWMGTIAGLTMLAGWMLG